MVYTLFLKMYLFNLQSLYLLKDAAFVNPTADNFNEKGECVTTLTLDVESPVTIIFLFILT